MNKISPGQLRVWKNHQWVDFGRTFVVVREYVEESIPLNERFWFVYSVEDGAGPMSESMILKDSKVLR